MFTIPTCGRHTYSICIRWCGFRMRSRDLGRMAQRLCRALPVPRQVRPGLWRVSPLVVPFQASPFLCRVNDTLLVATLGWHLHLLGLRSPLIWSYNPMLWDVVRRLPHRGVVYHCVDDLRAAPGIDATAVEMAEKQFGRIADVCFVTSRELQHRMALPSFRICSRATMTRTCAAGSVPSFLGTVVFFTSLFGRKLSALSIVGRHCSFSRALMSGSRARPLNHP